MTKKSVKSVVSAAQIMGRHAHWDFLVNPSLPGAAERALFGVYGQQVE